MCKKNKALFKRNFAKLNSLEERRMYKECVICMFVRKCTFLSKIEMISSAKTKQFLALWIQGTLLFTKI